MHWAMTAAMRRALTSIALLCALGGCTRSATHGVPDDAVGRSRRVDLVDVTLHTFQLGNANANTLRIAVHGGPGLDHTYLRPWLDPLVDRGALLYVDLRGHGRSSLPADAHGYRISAAANDLARLIERVADGGPSDVIAHEFGAMVALELAAQHPERVRRLVLINPLWRPAQLRAIAGRTRETLGEAGWQRIQALTTAQGTLRDAQQVTELFRRLGRMWWSTPPTDAVLTRMGRDMQYSGTADRHFLNEAATWDGEQRVEQVRAQTLVVHGNADRTFTVAESRQLADRLPHGRYAEIAGAGHLPFIEQRERTLTAVRAFLNEGRTAE